MQRPGDQAEEVADLDDLPFPDERLHLAKDRESDIPKHVGFQVDLEMDVTEGASPPPGVAGGSNEGPIDDRGRSREIRSGQPGAGGRQGRHHLRERAGE